MITSGLRICSKCGVEKPLDDFHANQGSRRPDCVSCNNAACRARYKANRAVRRKNGREWYLANLDKAAFYSARTRARRAGATKFMSLEEWTELRAQTNCHWCRCELKRSFTNVDHVVPLAEGGQHTRENVVPSCANCNMEREWQRKTATRKGLQ